MPGPALETGGIADRHGRSETGCHNQTRLGGGDVGGAQQDPVMPGQGYLQCPLHRVGDVADIDELADLPGWRPLDRKAHV